MNAFLAAGTTLLVTPPFRFDQMRGGTLPE